MQRSWHVLARGMAVTTVAGGLVFAAGHLGAQQAPLSGGNMSATVLPKDETVRLFAGPKGSVFRLIQVEGDARAGGGSLTLAAARPKDAWQNLVQVESKQEGVTVRDGDVAIGPNGEMAMIYRWWRFDPRSKQLRIARSDDGGQTWSQPTTQIDGSGTAFDPEIVWARGKDIVIAWSDERRGRRLFDVYARRSSDAGLTWQPEQLLSRFERNGPSDLYIRPQLLSDGERIWAIWTGLRGTRSSVYMNRSVDGGKTWTDPVSLTGESRSVFGQTLLRAGERLMLVWNDTPPGQTDRIFATSSLDGGLTWGVPTRVDKLSAEASAASSFSAVLSPDGEALVAWQDARNGREDIFLARSTDGGVTWGNDQRMDMDEAGTAISRLPRLARAADGRVALAWEDDRAGQEAMYLRIRSAGAKPEWSPEITAVPSAPKIAARVPELLWGGNELYLGWQSWDYQSVPGRVQKKASGKSVTLEKK